MPVLPIFCLQCLPNILLQSLNSTLIRLAENTGAQLLGPSQEANDFPMLCNRWLSDGDEVVPGMLALELEGSKTPGELALLLEGSTIISGDLIRAHEGGALCLLPSEKLSNKRKAIASLQRLMLLPELEALLPGDGWPVFRDAKILLQELFILHSASEPRS